MELVSISETDGGAITRLLSSNLPRTVARHAIIVLHYFRTISDEELPIDVLLGGCVLYAVKQRQYPDAAEFLSQCLERAKESDIVGFELLLVQLVRHNVLLIETCLRSVFHEVLLDNPVAGCDRERTIKVCLHIISLLYKTRWCLFPETAARAAFLVACEKCDVKLRKLPCAFGTPMATEIAEYLRDYKWD
ncbi:uncharacterized protein Tco025E_04666 [Trypanosoma conorhini]|uniref:Uncharacterized protein n=1 Tax=Trypanosoma conorhini TaxID=83891 RepID=A0A3R7N883_9TRYP|nr:uncharacterized protein Tco025E_04666 [Trypanosoma conorhini]RNF17899.1 hypothetical protein Tco025E_04666 [Trypanosoma conorhini]